MVDHSKEATTPKKEPEMTAEPCPFRGLGAFNTYHKSGTQNHHAGWLAVSRLLPYGFPCGVSRKDANHLEIKFQILTD